MPPASRLPVALVTGANGEIGRLLVRRLAAPDPATQSRRYAIITLDLTPPNEQLREHAVASYAGNIMDRYLLDQIAAHHDIEAVFHLAALLSTRGERDPELAHQVNVEGTLNLLRVAQSQSARLGRAVRFLFPSSVAAYGIADLDQKREAGAIAEHEHNVPMTMYGCNKLYCEHLGRYFSNHFHQLGALSSAARLDFRSLRFPGLISAETVPAGGTSDFGPEMLHAAAQGKPYACFVGPDTTIPFMAMPDAVRALTMLDAADRSTLGSCVYNVTAFSVSAGQIAERVKQAFPDAELTYAPDAVRQRIVDSWPADMDDTQARKDWGWSAEYGFERAFEEYLLPGIRARYDR